MTAVNCRDQNQNYFIDQELGHIIDPSSWIEICVLCYNI